MHVENIIRPGRAVFSHPTGFARLTVKCIHIFVIKLPVLKGRYYRD